MIIKYRWTNPEGNTYEGKLYLPGFKTYCFTDYGKDLVPPDLIEFEEL